MRYLSVCSGIEAASVAWGPLGWEPWAFAEVDAFPSAVLAHHYPTTPNLGDMSKFQGWPDAAFDVLVGGTPCQSFSVAGLRKGLDDPRGGLLWSYLAIARRYRPRWVVWENVPGVLSIDDGRAFGSLLGGLAELGYGFAYRVLDAVGFGTPCIRRRVFVVGHRSDWRKAAAVLFERTSLAGRGEPPAGERGWTAFHATQEPIAGAFAPAFGANAYVGLITPSDELLRLCPLELERLLGFPDGYTGQVAADGPRYKALGNSFAVNVVRWIGRRIHEVDVLARQA